MYFFLSTKSKTDKMSQHLMFYSQNSSVSVNTENHHPPTNLAVEDGVGVERPGPGHGPAHLHRLVQAQHPVLEGVGVGAADERGPRHPAPAPGRSLRRHAQVFCVAVVRADLRTEDTVNTHIPTQVIWLQLHCRSLICESSQLGHL